MPASPFSICLSFAPMLMYRGIAAIDRTCQPVSGSDDHFVGSKPDLRYKRHGNCLLILDMKNWHGY